MEKICLDSGILSLYFSQEPPVAVQDLFNKIKKKEVECYVLSPVLIEVYWNICQTEGIEIARISISSFIHTIPHYLVHVDEDLILSAGKLKCQHPTTLSYIDCVSIAFCINNKCILHTTEKNIKKIPHITLQRLKVVKHTF